MKYLSLLLLLLNSFALSQTKIVKDTIFIIVPESFFTKKQIDCTYNDSVLGNNELDTVTFFDINLVHENLLNNRKDFLKIWKKFNVMPLNKDEKDALNYYSMTKGISFKFRHYNKLTRNDSIQSKKYDRINIDSLLAYSTIREGFVFTHHYNCCKFPISNVKTKIRTSDLQKRNIIYLDNDFINITENKYLILKSDVVYMNLQPINLKEGKETNFYEVRLEEACNMSYFNKKSVKEIQESFKKKNQSVN